MRISVGTRFLLAKVFYGVCMCELRIVCGPVRPLDWISLGWELEKFP